MAKSEWGKKRTCQSCGAPFYDLKKKNIECPKCGAAFDPEPPAKPKRSMPGKPAEVKPPQVEEKPIEPVDDAAAKETTAKGGAGNTTDEDVAEGAGDDGAEAKGSGADGKAKDNGLIEDTSDLGENDDDMSEVKEHIDDGTEDKN